MSGAEMLALAAELFPICRSITGNGVRKSLEIIGRQFPIELTEVPSGTPVLDWTVPKEWNVREAWIADPAGRRVVDFAANNLHLLQYSSPFRGRLPLAELQRHFFSLPDQPAAIPYRTSYYQKRWGFCLSQQHRDALVDGEYDVCVDASLEAGALTYGEILIPGESSEEIFLSAHICHPSLANDNLSGIVVALATAKHFAALPRRRFSLRVLFAPGTIGAITWLARNPELLPRMKYGLVLTGLGMNAPLHYKKTVFGTAAVDRVLAHVLDDPAALLEFSPYGYDERQFNSPGFRLPVGCLMRAPFGSYPEYHTDGDNLSFIQAPALEEALQTLLRALDTMERDQVFKNLLPHGEPQLGRRGLYAATPEENLALLWVLNLSDGQHSLLDISAASQLPFARIAAAAQSLQAAEILRAVRCELVPNSRPSL